MKGDLHVYSIESERLSALRKKASFRLTGEPADAVAATGAVDALAVLHTLAATPKTASDALKLLHELQVYQVELDLQAQEMKETRAQLEAALNRQLELYDGQPVGSFTIDPARVVHELNRTGADMLGVTQEEAAGMPLDAFFSIDSLRRFGQAIANVGPGRRVISCVLGLCPRHGTERRVLVSVAADPAANRYLVSVAEVGDAQDLEPART